MNSFDAPQSTIGRLSFFGRKAFSQPVSFGVYAVVLLCMADLFWTLLVLLKGVAVEANPVLAWSFELGPVPFALVKALSFMPGVWAIEMCRLHNARFANFAARLGVYGYMAVYLFGSLRLHGWL